MYGGTITVIARVSVTCDTQQGFIEAEKRILDKVSAAIPRKRIGIGNKHKHAAKVQYRVITRVAP